MVQLTPIPPGRSWITWRSVSWRSELDKEVDRQTKPRPGTHTVLLLWGSASRGGFTGVKGQKGPCQALVKRICERRVAVVVYCDEYRSSKLSLMGTLMKHPVEKRKEQLTPKRCRLQRGSGVDGDGKLRSIHSCDKKGARGCTCFCTHPHCLKKRTRGCVCY